MKNVVFHIWDLYHNASVIRQNDESQNGLFKKTKHAKFSEKRILLSPWYAHVNTRNVRKIWRALFSWNTRLEIYPFALLPTNVASNKIFLNIRNDFNILVGKVKIKLGNENEIWAPLLHNFTEQSLNSYSAQVLQILLAACPKFSMVRIFDNCLGWK